MSRFYPNKAQEDAFKEVVTAMKKAKRKGLVFYGKADVLAAYTKAADDYNEEVDFGETLGTGLGQVPVMTALGCLADSGADDYPSFRNIEDEEKYS